MWTTRDMALQGRDAAARALYSDGRSGEDMPADDYATGLVDALANLMHFARHFGIDFEQQLERAYHHHEVEQRYGWEEVPDA